MTRIGFTASLPTWEALSLKQQIAQMVVVRASGHLFDHQIEYPVWEPPNSVLQRWVQELGVGGVILLGGTAAEIGLRTHQLQDWAEIPLLLAADIEEGVGQRFAGATWFPPPMAFSQIAKQNLSQAIDLSFQMGKFTAQEAVAIGLNWVLAPVVDVNNNPANPVINVRSFGDDPAIVSQLTTAFIRGAQQLPVLTSAKHFPGHGDTATDSHLELPVIPHNKTRLETTEFPPFVEAIAAGVDTVMTAHLQIPALDPEPATLSQPILTGILRQQMNFQGLIVTDALIMGAITQRYGANEAPILALEAGADILLMPADPEGAIAAICEAVETGRIPLERIHASLDRIWQAKQKLSKSTISGSSSHAWEQIPPPPIEINQLAQPEAIDCATRILRDSMTVHCPPNALRERRSDEPRRNLIVVDDVLNCTFLGRQAPAITLPAEWGYKLQLIDQTIADAITPDAQPPLPTLLQLFIRGNPFRNSARLTQIAKDWLIYLLQTDQLLALVIYGSPYVMESLVAQLPANIPYSFTYGQMPLAQSIVLGELGGESERSGRSAEFTD